MGTGISNCGADIFAIIIGIFYQNKRFKDMNRRFEDINRRFEDVNRRFEDVNKRIDDIREEIKELKTDLREIKTLIVILIQKEAGVKVKEEAEKVNFKRKMIFFSELHPD